MGSYTELSINGYPLLSTKSFAIPEALTIFRETDKRVFERKFSERNPLVWGHPAPEDDEFEMVILYQCTAGTVAQRLDIMGFTIDRTKKDFDRLRLKRIEELAPEDVAVEDTSTDYRELLESLTFESYAENLQNIIHHRLRPSPFDDHKRKDISEIARYILDSYEDFFFGFFTLDIRCLIRLACKLVDTNAVVEQDLTEVVNAGYYGPDDPICANAVSELTSGYPANSRQIILAEGSSDTAIIRESLMLLYPDLADYYAFFDFGLSHAQGGAGQLVSIIKAFAAAGISNRIIALFDNDTAAREARRTLERISLPSNVAVLYYPILESLRRYPTEGPTGPGLFDVNGLAASIELYLGDDVLSQNGMRSPVQWRGFSEAIGAYQGEVMHKAQLQTAFWQKVNRCKADTAYLKESDWTGMNAILNAIFTAFELKSSA